MTNDIREIRNKYVSGNKDTTSSNGSSKRPGLSVFQIFSILFASVTLLTIMLIPIWAFLLVLFVDFILLFNAFSKKDGGQGQDHSDPA